MNPPNDTPPASPPESQATIGSKATPVSAEDETCFHEAHKAFHGRDRHTQYEESAYRVIAAHVAASNAAALAENAELKSQIETAFAYSDGQEFRSDFRTATEMRAALGAALARVAAADKEIERLKGEWHFQRHDADQLRSALTAARQELAQKENDIQWAETRISCDDSGAELLKERAAHDATKKALAEANELIGKILYSATYEGGVFFWVAKHDAVLLREGRAYAQLTKALEELVTANAALAAERGLAEIGTLAIEAKRLTDIYCDIPCKGEFLEATPEDMEAYNKMSAMADKLSSRINAYTAARAPSPVAQAERTMEGEGEGDAIE